MPHFPDQWLTFAVALFGAVQAMLAHGKAREAVQFASRAQTASFSTADAVDKLAEHPALAVPATGAPGVSLPQVLQYWDLLSKLIGYWAGFKGAAVGDVQTIAAIRTKINGRHVKLGPIPVEFES